MWTSTLGTPLVSTARLVMILVAPFLCQACGVMVAKSCWRVMRRAWRLRSVEGAVSEGAMLVCFPTLPVVVKRWPLPVLVKANCQHRQRARYHAIGAASPLPTRRPSGPALYVAIVATENAS